MAPHRRRVLLEILAVDDLEHGETDGGRDWVAAERVEVLHAVGERIGDRC